MSQVPNFFAGLFLRGAPNARRFCACWGAISRSVDLAYLDCIAVFDVRVSQGFFYRFIVIRGLNGVEATENFLGFTVRAIRHLRLAALGADDLPHVLRQPL